MKLGTTGTSRSRLLVLLPAITFCGGLANGPPATAMKTMDRVETRMKHWDPFRSSFSWLEPGLEPGESLGGFGGGGGGAEPTQTAKEQETDDRSGDCGETKGNPVVLYTGNKVEHELDFASGGEMGLYLQLAYIIKSTDGS